MILAPLDQSDPRLRQACAPVERSALRRKDQQLEIDALLKFVYGRGPEGEVPDRPDAGPATVGLSANQVGIMKQICVVDLSIGRRGYHDMYVLINPKIVWTSRMMAERTEGCVNFPHWWGVTHRPARLKVQALDRSGNELTLGVSGWPATLLSHEIDHLSGRLFIDRLRNPHEAHLVEKSDYSAYRKNKRSEWSKIIDVSKFVIPIEAGEGAELWM
jgi:peptide deformylase